MVLFDQEFGKEFYSNTKSIIKPGLFDHLSLFIRRNSKHCDISGRSDRLITDTFFCPTPACSVVKPANIFWHHLGLVECFYHNGLKSRGEVTPLYKKFQAGVFPTDNKLHQSEQTGWELED